MAQSREAGPETFRIYSAASIGSAIRHFRVQAKLSQAELAEQVGVDRTYLVKLENGRETEQVRRILRILRRLGVRMVFEQADW